MLAVSRLPMQVAIQVTLQSASNPSDPGLVIQNGQVTLLNAVTTTNLTFFGATFETDPGGMTFEYDSTNEQYVIFGGMSFLVDGTTLFDLTLGTGLSDAGILVENGILTQINGTITSSKFAVDPLSWQVKSAQLQYTNSNGNDVFVISGDFLFQELWTVENEVGSQFTSARIRSHHRQRRSQHQRVFGHHHQCERWFWCSEPRYHLSARQHHGDYNLDLPVSTSAVNVAWRLRLSLTPPPCCHLLAFSVNGEISLGDSGLEIVYGSLTVQNPNSVTNMVVTGTVTYRRWHRRTLAGTETPCLAATSTVTISARNLIFRAPSTRA